MQNYGYLKSLLLGGAGVLAVMGPASADQFNIPGGDLKTALDAYAAQTSVQLLYPASAVRGASTRGAKGEFTATAALSRILDGTGFAMQRDQSGAVAIVRASAEQTKPAAETKIADATPFHAESSVETIVVTSSKIKGDIQTVPIAITALSQEQLTSRQIAGGPDLVKEVPNLTFSKTNFTGYNIEIRGIGTQAISVTTDPAVAVSFNDIPFLRNHFFEQEFFDVGQVEVLRGPQGTLYGRNATAGVVNVVSAKPTDHWEAMGSVDVGNYNNRRMEGMVNIPISGDMLDLRIAGEWTKRDGYSFNEETGKSTDGRDLWSSRVSLLLRPTADIAATAIWEHFQENDDRLRSGKQLCARDNAPDVVDGPAGPQYTNYNSFLVPGGNLGKEWLSQGCHAASLYSAESFGTPDASSFPFIAALEALAYPTYIAPGTNPYAGVTQSHNLRVIESLIQPQYRAKNDTFEFNLDYLLTPELTLSSQSGYSHDSLYSTQDLNRYNTQGGIFLDPGGNTAVGQDGQFCDPQLGCSDRMVAQDISDETARQFYQEVRLASSFKGDFNFLAGANFLSYHTEENYQIMSNVITLTSEWANGVLPPDAPHIPFDAAVANACDPQPAITDPVVLGQTTFAGLGCGYIDPNPLGSVDRQGHNYFLSQNPYRILSWAGFGEVYYNLTDDLKFTGGLRYTDDKKHFVVKPSWTLIAYKGYPVTNIIDQEWREVTGRANLTWTPKLAFTDQTMVYGSYARGYKGGGANPPGVIPIMAPNGLAFITSPSNQTHPATFKPEFNDAFELGTKNTLADGDITLNGDIFLYKYQNYQLSQIIDRTAVNMNVNATVKGAEVETSWSPIPGLKLGFNGGYEDTRVDNGQAAIDVMDRTAGHSDWMVVKPFITETSNCILPTVVVNEVLAHTSLAYACVLAYSRHLDPVTYASYVADPPTDVYGDTITGYPGFNYASAPNDGEGFDKNLGGNQLPNAPHYTASLTADFTMPLSDDWAGTLHGDFYWQSQSFARVFNDRPYDKIRGYSTSNLAVIFTNSDGWQVMGYVKNVFNVTAITGAFLGSDDTGLTTNIFTTDPRLFGIRITKTF
jgi:iron complex outermembrane recepter protein